MKFKAGELEFNANVADSSEAPSPQTGASLRSLTIQFRAQKATMHEDVLTAAVERQNGGLYSFTDADEPDLEWRVRDSSSQYVGTEPWGMNHHVWRIEQVERLACERLVIGGVVLEPYEYAEAVGSDGEVRLAARAAVSEADLESLARLSGLVDVVREGISDTPRRMSVDYVWGPGRDGMGVAIRCEDEREPRVTLNQPAHAAHALADVLAVLQARGVLADDAISELQSRRHAARRVSNVDSWSLSE